MTDIQIVWRVKLLFLYIKIDLINYKQNIESFI